MSTLTGSLAQISKFIKTQHLKSMDHLPHNPAILVSAVNMLLRDEEFDTLEALCYNFNTEPEKLKQYLLKSGYRYDDKQMQFKLI